MKRPNASATDSLIRLRAANDRLAASLAGKNKGPRKSVPPSPWSKSDEILLNLVLERNARERVAK